MKLRDITEELIGKYTLENLHGKKEITPIYKNPTKEETEEISSLLNKKLVIRYIADPRTQTIYAFKNRIGHFEVAKALDIRLKDSWSGVAEVTQYKNWKDWDLSYATKEARQELTAHPKTIDELLMLFGLYTKSKSYEKKWEFFFEYFPMYRTIFRQLRDLIDKGKK